MEPITVIVKRQKANPEYVKGHYEGEGVDKVWVAPVGLPFIQVEEKATLVKFVMEGSAEGMLTLGLVFFPDGAIETYCLSQITIINPPQP